ncbi:hypothetical protein GCM10011504_54670 [Siccirubricoccus deserti]|nr:hypothetical protein GCM10011504_54670 [Siccirubricoccus deserti]
MRRGKRAVERTPQPTLPGRCALEQFGPAAHADSPTKRRQSVLQATTLNGKVNGRVYFPLDEAVLPGPAGRGRGGAGRSAPVAAPGSGQGHDARVGASIGGIRNA